MLRAEGIGDRRVLAAFRAVPRVRFVPAEAAGQAYLDEPVRIPHGTLGVPEHAPYRAIVVAAAAPRVHGAAAREGRGGR